MPTSSRTIIIQKGFVHIPILIIIALAIIVIGMIVLKPRDKSQPNPVSNAFQTIKEKITSETQSELIDGYPHECARRMGFDNYRTFRAFVIDPQDSDVLYAAVEYKGVYKSVDAGKTWDKKIKGLRSYPDKANLQIPCIEQHPLLVIDPTNSQRLILTSAASPGTLTDPNSESGGVYESVNGGESWQQLFSETMNAWTYEAFAFDPTNSQTMYVGTTAMATSHSEADPDKLFVTKGIVYKTADSGKNWEELPTGFVKDLRAGRIFVSSFDPKHILFTTIALPANTGGGQTQSEQTGILESKDGGKTWKTLESLPKDQRAIAQAAMSANFKNMFISVRQSDGQESLYYSTDTAHSFTKTNAQVNLFNFDPHDPRGLRLLGLNVYAAPRTIFESLDGGKTWSSYSQLPKEATSETRVSNIVWDPTNKDVVYMNGDEGRVWKSVDGGKTWESILSLDLIK